jgi:spermidine dehydrogenase
MKKTDQELGMGRPISRRDLIHHSTLAALGLALYPGGIAAATDTAAPYYPPTRTGLRGSHPGAFESAHALAREGKSFGPARELAEEYDLVVVGAGISGLAAARFYQKEFGQSSRILLLENHDDFGGHARRNEFHQGGAMRLAIGGTQNLEHWQFSAVTRSLMRELGIDVDEMLTRQAFDYGQGGRNGPAVWFDSQTYGQSKLVTNFSLTGREMGRPVGRIDELPLSEEAREQLKRFYSMRANVLDGHSDEQVAAYLSATHYEDFLREQGGLGEEAIQLYARASHGYWGLETRALSVTEALEAGMPGAQLLGYETDAGDWDYPAAMFPDGNASVARLQVKALIPAVAPSGTDASNIAQARFDYSQLDRPEHYVRLRLNATVINAVNTGPGVAVSYVRGGEVLQVTGRHVVMACYHSVIPHLCPDLPAAQQAALKYQVKRPLLLTNVLLRSSAAMDSLGITGAYCPGRMHSKLFLSRGINTGGYRNDPADGGPVPLTFWGSISPPPGAASLTDQLRASRATMLALSFEDYEREVRTVLDEMLGPAGFNVREDVLAITVNRWPHGYAHDYMDLWDPEWLPGEAPHEIARRPHGNIAIANADAGADAYTHVAIDQAFRAVQELGEPASEPLPGTSPAA